MVSPPLLLSNPPTLKFENWYARNSGLPEELFPEPCTFTIAPSLPNGDNYYRFSWGSGQNYMVLHWDGQKLTGGEVTLYQNNAATSYLLTVTIFKSPHPRTQEGWFGWFGELSLNGTREKCGWGDGNTGVFIAREEGSGCEPKEASSRSAGMGTSTAV